MSIDASCPIGKLALANNVFYEIIEMLQFFNDFFRTTCHSEPANILVLHPFVRIRHLFPSVSY